MVASLPLPEKHRALETNADFAKSCKNVEEKSGCENNNYKFLIWEFQKPLIWTRIISITLIHILAIWSFLTYPYYESVGTLFYTAAISILTGFGITAGAHRYWTHKTFKATLPLRLILLFCYSMAGQINLKEWVTIHRLHHKFSETDADPHNINRGFFFAHIGWYMMEKHPEFLKKERQMDCSDISKDPLVIFHEKYSTLLTIICCFILPTIIPPLLWQEYWMSSIKAVAIVRFCLGVNAIGFVNSVSHSWGNKPYDKNINSVENRLISIITIGEGYHNYHHTFPWDYKASEFGVFYNPTTYFLNFFEKIGWAYDLKTVPAELVKKVVENKGDGSHYKWGHEIPEEYAKST